MESSFLLRLVLLASALTLGACTAGCPSTGLKLNFYGSSCPNAEQIVRTIIYKEVEKNPILSAKLLRMFFHDCFVRGCDASLLLNSTSESTAEKDAPPNLSLAGFEVIDMVKEALEQACPGTVSCADTVALAARDSVSFSFGKSLWDVKTGRRDGNVSLLSEALVNIPRPTSNFTTLVQSFANKSLGVEDLVILSGAHTIGVGHCNLFADRLYNFTGKGDSDPSLNPAYAAFLRSKCSPTDNTTAVIMDPGSGLTFDSHYYVNLKQNKGLFQSDAVLLNDGAASKVVDDMVDFGAFLAAFRKSITKMGDIGVLTGKEGEIRKHCRFVN
ncbi:hypothetical protein OPV22_028675 [Ensete ventricosum]|uniref:Peroxidase n=1 Tax=Ensete ventricosum TaxID=4639 RepID=A0AAV8Q728_ENSVE|nr:hypothetical protein OPV22_028675 [Ensete ventricosum]